MNTPANEISVAIIDGAACVRICGRANFNSSHDFRRLISELQKSGHNRFRMDLCDCLIMDSTFLGVLARLALDAGDAAETEAVPLETPRRDSRAAGKDPRLEGPVEESVPRQDTPAQQGASSGVTVVEI